MPRARFEPATPKTEQPQTYALDRAATGIGHAEYYRLPKQLLKYHQKIRRRPGWPLKKLLHDANAHNGQQTDTIGTPTYRLAQHLAGLLEAHFGDSPHHVRNWIEFIDTIRTLQAGPRDILVSFDVVCLFTIVPIEEALRLLSRHFDEAILQLFRHVLISSFLELQWPVLRANRRCGDGFAAFPSHCKLFHGVLWRNGSGSGDP
jgi:hypothetical protein